MEKQKAIDRLDAIEKEAKELRKIITAPIEITEQIKTFKDACNYLELKTHKDAYKLIGMKRNYMCEIPIEECEDSYLRLCILTLALNENTEVDLTKETGYFLWFNHKNKPGSGFFDSDYSDWHGSRSVASSRLALRTSKLAMYSGKQFEQEHYNYMYN